MKIVYLFVVTFLVITSSIFGQNTLVNRVITISIVNKRFDVAIKLIEEESKITLCYNSDILPKNKIVTIKANNNRLDKVLISLLSSANLQMKEVNNQIVITKSEYSNKEAPPAGKKPKAESNRSKTEITGNIITVVDTVTHTINDTIIKTVYDTIRISVYDTKTIRYLNKYIAIRWDPKVSVHASSGLMHQMFNEKQYAPSDYSSYFNHYGNIEKSKQGYLFEGGISLKNNKAEVSLGIEYYEMHSDLLIRDLPTTFSKVTKTIVETTINPTDIEYTYRFDTTLLSYSYEPNQAHIRSSSSFYGFPISVSYKIIENNKLTFGVNFGLVFSKFIKGSGFDAKLSDGTVVQNNAYGQIHSRNNLAIRGGFDIEYYLNKSFSLVCSLQYQTYLKSIYSNNYPISEKPKYIYPCLLLKYYL